MDGTSIGMLTIGASTSVIMGAGVSTLVLSIYYSFTAYSALMTSSTCLAISWILYFSSYMFFSSFASLEIF
jgi:hypothetical protein